MYLRHSAVMIFMLFAYVPPLLLFNGLMPVNLLVKGGRRLE